MKRVIAAVVLVLGVVCGAALSVGAKSDEATGSKTYNLLFDNAFGLTEGGDFKVAGVRAGQTKTFKVTKVDGRPVALVEAEVTEPGLADLRKDARCEIRPQSLIGEYFVDCQPGTSDERLPDGGRVPVEQTSSTIAIDLVGDIMRRPYRDRFRLIIGELGAGLAGRPGDLSQVLRRAHPALRETSQTLRILGRQTDTIQKFIGDANTVVGALENRKQDVVRFVREAGQTAAISASRREQLGESFRRLPAFLTELEPYMGRLGDLTEAQTPVLRDLRSSADELDTFLTRLRPFTAEGLPAFKALGEASVVGRRAVVKTTPDVRELRLLAKDAPGFAKPLRQLLQTIDDRKRGVEPDKRAAASGPPAGDKTHTTSSRAGFTGMEAIWNFFYWQTLSTNAFDEVGHVLRLTALASPCSPYQVKPTKETIASCNGFLGPTQPGVTTPDPTRPGGSAATAASAPSSATPATPQSAPADPTNPALDFLLGQ
ncbi:MAG TPA: MlaD family protein [Thermoleophilaceae bacterium]|nr:MlaD family protein [Thermoleophilaceae bacterium]